MMMMMMIITGHQGNMFLYDHKNYATYLHIRKWQHFHLFRIKYILIMKANEMHYFSHLFDKVLYMFQTVDLSETGRVLYQINLRNSASCWLSL